MNSAHRLLLVCLAVLSTTSLALAQATTTSVTTETIDTTATTSTSTNETSESTLPEQPITNPTAVPTSAAPLSPATQLRVTNLAANLSNRFDATIDRLENILNRLESRTNKFEAIGHDVSAARTSITTTRQLLEQARSHMSNIDQEVAIVVGATNPQQEWRDLKTTYLSVRGLVQLAFAEMQTIISTLKTSQPIVNTEEVATTTESTI